ncbi:MAG TPA: glycosyltransferase [Myxococcota bacterium]|nr:glycosyltransferase [Myxococcota bacterium]
MKVSWLLPVRDDPRLAEALASIELEPGDEVVVVDDGSLVPVPGAIRQPASGLVAALERGRARCRNPLIARLDADDLALPGRIGAQRRFLRDHPEVAAVGGRARIESATPGMQAYVDWVNTCDVNSEIGVESPLFHPAVTFRAEAVEAVGGYRALLAGEPIPEDYDLWLRLHAAGWRLGRVEEEVLLIRDHPERLTRTHPAYTRAAFQLTRQAHFGALLRGRRVAVYGAGKRGRAWLRLLEEVEAELVGLVDVKPGGTRRGHSIRPIEALGELDFDVLLVAIPRRALAESRAAIHRLRGDLVEGTDWWAVG